MAVYEAVVATVPILLIALASGPLRLFGLLGHRTARRHRRRDLGSDRDAVIMLGAVYAFAVIALVLEPQHVGWRLAAGCGLLLAAYLVFVSVWASVRASYDSGWPSGPASQG